MNATRRDSFEIEAVRGRKQLDDFIAVPWSIYRDDPHWVPPLVFEQKQRLTKKNPFFEHARWQAWTARHDGRLVGRISAQIDQLYLKQHADKCGYFGMMEAEDNPALFNALLSTAEGWLRDQGMHRVRGPFNLSINEDCGLLVDGFETPPFIMMGHAHSYYGPRLETCGYIKAKDLIAYYINTDYEVPRVMEKLVKREAKHIRLRCLRRKQLGLELEILRDIFNDAWSGNWGFVPFTKAEFTDIGELLTLLVDDDFVQIAEIDGRPVAMAVALPNINEVIRDLDGRLLPFGWVKLLWRIKVHYPTTARVPLLGVRKEYQNSRLSAVLAFLVMNAANTGMLRRGIKSGEMSWILEDNVGMRSILETIGGKAYKRYRIYEKDLYPDQDSP